MLLADPHRVLVEVGPGGTLTASAMRHPKWSSGHRAVRLMRHQAPEPKRPRHLPAGARATLVGGCRRRLDSACGAATGRRRVSLPGYPFERQRHWVEPQRNGRGVGDAARDQGAAAARRGRGRCRDHRHERQSQIEATLQRIWAQCLGLGSIDRNANFFELGGDSLIAISVAMTAANEGLDLTPQDLYENQTRGRARGRRSRPLRCAGGLARQSPMTWCIPQSRRTSRASSSTGCAIPVAGAFR